MPRCDVAIDADGELAIKPVNAAGPQSSVEPRDGIQPDHPDRFAAFCDAIRWSSVARLPGLSGDGVALVSPWESAVLPEPYQLYPVLKALEMPRVSLLLADDDVIRLVDLPAEVPVAPPCPVVPMSHSEWFARSVDRARCQSCAK